MAIPSEKLAQSLDVLRQIQESKNSPMIFAVRREFKIVLQRVVPRVEEVLHIPKGHAPPCPLPSAAQAPQQTQNKEESTPFHQ